MRRDRGSSEKPNCRSDGCLPKAIGRNPSATTRDGGAGYRREKSTDQAANENPILSGASANDGAEEAA